MWVFSPMEQPVDLVWAKKACRIKHGINEIPEAVAQAYFLHALPERVDQSQDEFKASVRNACNRWGMVLKAKPVDAEFLSQFDVADTREGLEQILVQKNIKLPEPVKENAGAKAN